jgi:hypothetical protein
LEIGTRTPIFGKTIEGKMVWKLGLMGSYMLVYTRLPKPGIKTRFDF